MRDGKRETVFRDNAVLVEMVENMFETKERKALEHFNPIKDE